MFRFRFVKCSGFDLRRKMGFFSSNRPLSRFVLFCGLNSISANRLAHITRASLHLAVVRSRCFASYSTQTDKFSSRLWRVLKGILTFTGGVFWVVPVFLYGGYLAGLVQVDVEERDQMHFQQEEAIGGVSEFRNGLLSFYNIRKEADKEALSTEVHGKDYAFMKLWTKLRNEEGILKRFGEPVRLSAFHVPDKILREVSTGMSETPKSRTAEKLWKACCYVEGPRLKGLLEVEFSLVNSEWIPVSLQLEGLQKSGDVICNVSAPLPNGLTRFTRLSND